MVIKRVMSSFFHCWEKKRSIRNEITKLQITITLDNTKASKKIDAQIINYNDWNFVTNFTPSFVINLHNSCVSSSRIQVLLSFTNEAQ